MGDILRSMDEGMEEMEKALQRRDPRFIVRLVIRLGIVIAAGIYAVLWLSDQNVGGCTARGFETLTGAPATPSVE